MIIENQKLIQLLKQLLEWYPESFGGVQAARYIAERCGDEELFNLIRSCENVFANANLFSKGKQKAKAMEKVTSALGEPEHFPFWEFIFEMIKQASKELPMRDYGPERNAQILEKRKAMEAAYRARGYDGEFPYMSHPETGKKVYFFEEQPFTVLEEDGYDYKVFALEVS